MKTKDHFFKAVCTLAIPVALQSMLQSSFSMVDQIMIGQLGEINVAGVGLAGKFASIYSVVISAIGAVAGIMIAQYLGQKNRSEVRRSFFTNLLLGAGIAGMFMVICTLFPNQIMGAYTRDVQTRQAAAEYLMLISGTFVPMAGATLLSTLFRCLEKPRLPLYASILSALLNTGLNYIMIFGKLGISPMGVRGAAFATVISQCANFLLMLLMLSKNGFLLKSNEGEPTATLRMNWGQYWSMLLPLLVCEVVWSLGENVYAAIYGHMSTDASAAMTLTNPIQGLVIGALCGLSQAASVIIGKHLGSGENEEAYWSAKKLMLYGAIGSALLSVIVMIASKAYVGIYQVDNAVKTMTMQILFAYAIVVPFKVLNMILGGGIIRSGGRTKYVMFIDMVGTWCFGVPLGLLSAFVWKLSIPYVYFLLSLEECIRFGISLIVFRRRKWMNQLEAS
ncbi:MAG: MATE family efflux transporter [Anaerolineaceae bacterium]|nr:MATE family efflux transporter [Anaerolineaceae bacterium]